MTHDLEQFHYSRRTPLQCCGYDLTYKSELVCSRVSTIWGNFLALKIYDRFVLLTIMNLSLVVQILTKDISSYLMMQYRLDQTTDATSIRQKKKDKTLRAVFVVLRTTTVRFGGTA